MSTGTTRTAITGIRTATDSGQRGEPGVVQVGVATLAAGDQLGRRAVLDDNAVLEHEHAVGDLDRGEPVRDDDRRALRQDGTQRALDEAFAGDIERRRRL